MHPEQGDPDADHRISPEEIDLATQKSRATPTIGRYKSDMVSYGQDIAPSPSFDDSDDSVPGLGQPGSPSPTGRRTSIASFGDSVPGTPTTGVIEEARVDSDLHTSSGYHRIHSTPYPKPRLPLQLTPHPQARVVSLPEWTQNRNPFLEALRNLRSVSSPARLKRARLSPMSVESEGTSANISQSSSASLASVLSFPALSVTSEISLQAGPQTTSGNIPQKDLYAAPESFYCTPPSFKSFVLSPLTTGPERSLPRDRPLAAIREDVSHEADSEAEVLAMLHQATPDAQSRYSRSSAALSATSRSTSPESVVFLSSISRVPRAFLRNAPDSSSAAAFDPTKIDPAVGVPTGGSQEDLPSHTGRSQQRIRERTKREDHVATGESRDAVGFIPDAKGAYTRQDSDWIFFDPPKPIPALHGPPSLPYARCPSGAEGVILDDLQTLDGVIWGLPETDTRVVPVPVHTNPQGRPVATKPTATGPPRLDADSLHTTRPNTGVPKKGDDDTVPYRTPNADSGLRQTNSITRRVEQPEAPAPSSKEKHVRFLDAASASSSVKDGPPILPKPLANPTSTVQPEISAPSRPPTDLSAILLAQVEKAHAIQPAKLQYSVPPVSRQQTLDQLRRFGVPFKPRGHPTPPNTAPPTFTPQFQPLTESIHAPSPRVVGQPIPQMTHSQGPGDVLPLLHDAPSKSALNPTRFAQLPPSVATSGSGSLSNVKSIPLLKLRQRQHAGSLPLSEQNEDNTRLPSQCVHTQPTGEVQVAPAQRSSFVDPPASSISRPPRQDAPINAAPTFASGNKSATSASNKAPSPNRRRSRKGGKRAAPDTSILQSTSPSKENDRANKGNEANTRKTSSQQGGRKKDTQRSRSDSLPQNASRT